MKHKVWRKSEVGMSQMGKYVFEKTSEMEGKIKGTDAILMTTYVLLFSNPITSVYW